MKRNALTSSMVILVLIMAITASRAAVSFNYEVMPTLTRLGCNSASCHGSKSDSGALTLSLFGGNASLDYQALTDTNHPPLLDLNNPPGSNLLRVLTGANPHADVPLLNTNSQGYLTLLEWINEGTPGPDNNLKLQVLDLTPNDPILKPGQNVSLKLRARFSDGSNRDVLGMAIIRSSNPHVAIANEDGQLSGLASGVATVVATFGRQTATTRVIIPNSLTETFPETPFHNRIDQLVIARLRQINLPPSGLSTDSDFLRRLSLDVMGLIPTPQEVRAFLADKDPDKRTRLIDKLLEGEAHAEFIAMKWGDLLRIKSEYPVRLWPKGAVTYHRWVRDSLAANKPYDLFVRELLTTSGSNFRDGAVNFYRAVPRKDPQTIGETAALIFMGARLGCARCHAHPEENWTMKDNQALGAFFAQVGYKATTEWKEEIIFHKRKGTLRDPLTKKPVLPATPDGMRSTIRPGEDPRLAFADWLIREDNPWFTRNIVNRVWSWYMGRGLVHPVDDFRASNPPSHPELLDFLAAELVNHDYDLRHISRLILNSRTYQLSSVPNQWNGSDSTHFSHYIPRRAGAEQLVDAICQVTGVQEVYSSSIPEPFTRMPSGIRAVQLPDGNLRTAVLEMFGSSPRDTPYDAERCTDVSERQALYMLNSEDLERKINKSPRLKNLLQSQPDNAQLIKELYFITLSRPPTGEEVETVLKHFGNRPASRNQAVRDLAWALLNTREFMFLH